jgi:aspartate/methionine/tyrosine aminotransferase
MVAEFNRRRQIILKGISQADGLSYPAMPRGAFYVFVHHHIKNMDSVNLADYILENAGVAVIPGTSFGKRGEGFLRISYAASQADCREGMARIAEISHKLTIGK